MKRTLFNAPNFLTYCFCMLLSVLAADVHAQCSASIPSTTLTSCQGQNTLVPVTFQGTPPFTFSYQVNGVPFPAVISPGLVYNLEIPAALQGAVVQLINMQDQTGCQGGVSGLTIIQVAPSMVISSIVVPPFCSNGNNGSIQISVSGGIPPYAYIWSTGVQAPTLQSLSPGVYDVTVTDANGCIATRSMEVEADFGDLVGQLTPPSCNQGSDGFISLTNNFGPDIQYQWSNGATTKVNSNLVSNIYTVTVTDPVGGCTKTATFALPQPSQITVTAVPSPTSCAGVNDGSINVTVAGGAPIYTHIWSNGSTTKNLTGLQPGTYTTTVTDANGCTATATATILAPPPIDLNPTVQAPGCGASDGGIDLSISGGVSPYQTTWSNGSVEEDLTNVGTGVYTVTVTDATGCSVKRTESIGPFDLNTQVSFESCAANIDLEVAGGTPPYLYAWTNQAATQDISQVPVGTYRVTVTDATGCTSVHGVTIEIPGFSAYIVPGIAACNGTGGLQAFTNPFSLNPYTYTWSNGATTKLISNIPSGVYTVTVTDMHGCTATATRALQVPDALTASWVVSNTGCNSSSGAINLTASGGQQPLTYTWRNEANALISTAQDPSNLPAGTYRVTVTASSGCSYTSPEIVVQSSVVTVTIGTFSSCNSSTLISAISGGLSPYQYVWTGPSSFSSNMQNIIIAEPGIYTVIVTDATGCTASATLAVQVPNIFPCGAISGRVVRDDSENCLADAGENGLSGWLVKAEGVSGTFYGVSNVDGDYWVHATPGSYVVSAIPPNGLWDICPSGPAVTLTNAEDTIPGGELLVTPQFICPQLTVTIGSSVLRRCFNNNYYYLNYCNTGTSAATDAYVLVTLDPLLSAVSASIPFTNLGNNVLRFPVGDVAPGQCGSFNIRVQVSCNAVLGQTHCTEAHIYPDGDCIPPDDAWSGASLRLTSQCSADSVRFTIKNVGNFDMQTTSDYIVVEDAVMLMQAPFQLGAGDSSIVALPANGSTWRMEVGQVQFHPGLSAPGLSVEGCTTSALFSTGYVTQFPNNDQDPWLDIDCRPNVGSYDPNDKQGFPVGYSQEHYIRPKTEIEYMIRFQNTGTDTAFTVRIADTLSAWLDPATIRPGVSSHPYKFNLTGTGMAEFLFENILLPDSNVNEAASHGFVTFSIYPKAGAPLETLIENTAHIYFDFNDAVVTNTTRHRLGENFVTVGLWQPERAEYELLVSPNPFHETALLEVKGLTSSSPIHLQIIDLQGNVIAEETAAGPSLTLRKAGLPVGMYLFKIDQKGVLIGSGKLVIRD